MDSTLNTMRGEKPRLRMQANALRKATITIRELTDTLLATVMTLEELHAAIVELNDAACGKDDSRAL